MSSSAIVLAGGRGSRMGSDIPKQYMQMASRPVIVYSLRAFADSSVDEIVLVCGAGDEEYCRHEIVEKYDIPRVSIITAGGAERVDSVYRGVLAAEGEFVLVHDGARPFIKTDMIDKMISEVTECGAVIAAVPCSDTIKRADKSKVITETLPREELYSIQTPQAFDRGLLLDCYGAYYDEIKKGTSVPAITDDSMLIERYSNRQVRLFMSDKTNIKITTPEDLSYGEYLLSIP